MKQFDYTVKNSLGICTHSAGMLAKLVKGYSDTVVTVTKGGETAKTSQLMKLVTMGVKQGDALVITAEGPEESKAIVAVRAFFEEKL